MTNDIVSIEYDELNYSVLKSVNNNILWIDKLDIHFYIRINLKENNDKLVVFSNGAIDRSKKSPPIFMRSSWAEEINAHCIFVDDPTIHNSLLTIGWGIGTENHYYLKTIHEILSRISLLLNIENTNVLYYGSSAGGTMSVMLATMHKGSSALVNNPQAYTYKYLKGQVVEKIKLKHFPNWDTAQLISTYPERFSITACFKKNNHIPNILYVFNGYSFTDYDKQYIPLSEELRSSSFDISNIEFLMYHDKKLKHGPLSRDRTVKLINANLLK